MKTSILIGVFYFCLIYNNVAHSEEEKIIGYLNVFEGNDGKISLVQNRTWKPVELTKDLKDLYETRGFTELELVHVNLTPELIEVISSFSKLTHLTIGEPPEGVFLKDKMVLLKLTRLKRLTNLTLCIVDSNYDDFSFLKNMPKLWKVTIIKAN